MATTTTNFGWDIPQSTDLVKDGATAIAALGQDIDTALVDLKGGSTGQVLAKASNTDLDYSWTTPQVGDITAVTAGTGISGGGTGGDVTITNSMATAIDAKGDLIAGTGADTFSRLAAGSNGEIIVADSSTSTGLRYQGTQSAGKNALINGGFDIWQRGTSSSTLGAYTTADRWYLTAISGSGTFAQEATVKPSNSNYSLKFTASATSQPLIYQVIETSNALQFAGQTVVLSGKFASSASVTFSLGIEWSASTDVGIGGSWTSITPTSTSAASPTSTTFVDGRAVFAIPSTARSLRVGILPTTTIANGVVLYWSQLLLELGSIPTFFTRTGGTISGELAACQRYYYLHVSGTALSIGNAGYYSASQVNGMVQFPVTMRIAPTLNASSGTDYYVADRNGGSDTFNSFIIYRPSTTTAMLYNGSEASGTAGHAALLYTNNSSSSIAFSSEL